MTFHRTYIPTFPLNQYVDAIWIAKKPRFEIESTHHAPLFTELIFNYGSFFAVQGEQIEENHINGSHHIISGLKTNPFQTVVSGYYCNVGLILKPFCYRVLLDKLQTKSMETISYLLYDYLVDVKKPDFKSMEPYLHDFFKYYQIEKDLLKFENYISFEILKTGFLREFSNSLTITQKGFIQKFKKHYFLTPNQYIKLRQVNYVISLLKHNQTKTMTEIGLEAGFYDQSHFIRVFKKYCGFTPKDFKKTYMA